MKISVAVPVRNEERTVGELLRRLLSQTRPPDEIVITDGGSDDTTTEIISEFIKSGAPVKLIRAGEALPGRGRNLAAAAANYEWVAFIDGGVEPEPNWLDTLASTAEQDSDVAIVYGGWEPVTDTFFQECAAITYVPPPTLTKGVMTRPRFIASSLMKRCAWQSVGGFPEDLRSGEDLLFMNNIEAAGFTTVFEPKALVRWHLRSSFAATFKRFMIYARNNMRAGLWKQWQASLFSRYFLLLVASLAAIAISPVLFLIPLLLFVLMLLARAVVAIRRNRNCYPGSAGRNLRRLPIVMALIATIDAAAIVGTTQWLLFDWLRGNGKTTVEAGNGA